MKIKSLLALSLIATAPSLQAALVLQDNMNYGASNIVSTTPAGDWNLPSNRLLYNASTNLTFSGDADYVNASANAGTGSMERTAGSLERVANRDFSNAALTGEFWMSAVINVTSSATTGAYSGISLNTAATAAGTTWTGDVLGVGYDGTALKPIWYDDSANAKTFSSTTVPVNSTVLLVAMLNIGAGADSFSMWVFDSADSFGLTVGSLGTAHLSSSTADFGDELDKIQLGGDPFQSYFDQIRISSLSGDSGLQEVLTLTTVPEPRAALLGGLGLLALLRRRRG